MKKVVDQVDYINSNTGEVETMNVISSYGDSNFDKIWIGHLVSALDIVGNQKIKIVNYLIQNRIRSNNMIIASQRDLSIACKVSLQTVNLTIKALKEVDFIKEVKRGVYQLNPECIFKGSAGNRMNILLQYNKTNNE